MLYKFSFNRYIYKVIELRKVVKLRSTKRDRFPCGSVSFLFLTVKFSQVGRRLTPLKTES
jgi:hypothetical protein